MQVGNDIDSHGCIGSAGYQWSELLQDCIRIFELPIQLINVTETQIAGLTFSNDKSKAEVFTANGSFILTKETDFFYTLSISPNFKFLTQKNGKWEFGDNKENKIEYKEK